jgi:hypothetical protein
LKTCNRCKETKPYEEFTRRAESPDGRTPSCKVCISERRKERRAQGLVGNAEPVLTVDQKKHVYTSVILRMREQGLTSAKTTDEMLARVGEL